MSQSEMSLNELIAAIDSDPRYVEGTIDPPRRIVRSEALVVVDEIFTACDQADAHMPTVAENLDLEIACGEACQGGCCESLILITLTEALAIVRKLASKELANSRDGFVRGLDDWHARFGDRAQAATRAFYQGDESAYLDFVREHGRDHVMCPLSVDRRCAVHDARPLKCRQLWVVDTWKYCAAPDTNASSEPGAVTPTEPAQPDATALSFTEFDALHERAQRVLRGLQHALGHGAQKRPLVTAVREALALLAAE